MRIVMPLFDFCYESSGDFAFAGGKYSITCFDSEREIPEIELFSRQDVEYMQMESCALVAHDPDLEKYKGEVNLLLLSFRIYRLACVFIKYRLCKEDYCLCTRLNDIMHMVLPKESNRLVSKPDLEIIDRGFAKLLHMESISNRTHNAVYFIYRGLCSEKMLDSFVFLMMAVESLFSKEDIGGATKTICSRVSAFLDSKERCTYEDINKLYDLRSRMVHGKVVVEDEIKGNLTALYDLQYVVVECMKKILDEEIYAMYGDVDEKEEYFRKLASC